MNFPFLIILQQLCPHPLCLMRMPLPTTSTWLPPAPLLSWTWDFLLHLGLPCPHRQVSFTPLTSSFLFFVTYDNVLHYPVNLICSLQVLVLLCSTPWIPWPRGCPLQWSWGPPDRSTTHPRILSGWAPMQVATEALR